MQHIKKHIETIHGLPEGIRRFLAGSCLILAVIGMFYSWRYTVSVRLTDLSQTGKISEHRREELAGETNVLVLRDRGGVRQEFGSDRQLVLANTPAKERTAAVAARTPGMFDWIFSGLNKVTTAGIKTAAVSYDTVAGLISGNNTNKARGEAQMHPSGIGSIYSAIIGQTQQAIQGTSAILERSANAISGAIEGGFQKIRNIIDTAKIR